MIAAPLVSAKPSLMTARSESGGELAHSPVVAGHRTVPAWIAGENAHVLKFAPGNAVTPSDQGEIFLELTYLDRGYGRIDARLTGAGGEPVRPDRYLNLSLTDSGEPTTARMRFPRTPGADSGDWSVRIELAQPAGPPLAITDAGIQNTPFDDATFRYLVSDPWKGPYQGPSVEPADNRTLKGKVMTGYQGWFRTPNDPYGGGWSHWGDIPNGRFSIDMWPDVSGYPAHVLEKAADVKLKSGRQAYLFSSAWPEVTDLHFRWMREHDIDGAFLQRFVNDGFHSISGGPEWVLANTRAAAHREGRLWAVEYDVSGYPDARLLETLKTDWKWLVDEFGIRGDSHYARENGKPVVFIWGLPFPDRNIRPETADAVVDFFRNDPDYGGNHVIGGIPGNWRDMDEAWQRHIASYHCVLAWMSRSYAADIADFRGLGLPCYAHVMPGFSWANLKHLPTGDPTLAYTPRDGGDHYWKQFTEAAAAGADRVFVGMFDEYDEATAILPMSDDPPPTPVRPGVAATFFNGDQAREHGRLSQLPGVGIELGAASPADGIQADDFYVRMGGRITYPAPGSYTFTIEGAPGDDAELTIDGQRILDAGNLRGPATASRAVIAGPEGHSSFRLEYRHRSGSGKLRLLWESPDMARRVVPPDAFEDAWGRFITNEGRPADWWLKLTRRGKRLMNESQKERSLRSPDAARPDGAK